MREVKERSIARIRFTIANGRYFGYQLESLLYNELMHWKDCAEKTILIEYIEMHTGYCISDETIDYWECVVEHELLKDSWDNQFQTRDRLKIKGDSVRYYRKQKKENSVQRRRRWRHPERSWKEKRNTQYRVVEAK